MTCREVSVSYQKIIFLVFLILMVRSIIMFFSNKIHVQLVNINIFKSSRLGIKVC